MITFLSGGTGTPKLIRGARLLLPDSEISIIVNTGEDMWYQQGYLSPDIDTITYLFSNLLDTDKWWGIYEDTFHTYNFFKTLGDSECYLALGDKDRAVNLLRASLLHSGFTLTKATKNIADRLGISATILPMCDTPCTTHVETNGRTIHYQEYWIRYQGNITIDDIFYVHDTPPVAPKQVINAILQADIVVLGPSNPITSIGPILHCAGVKEALSEVYVVAVSPFIGDAPVSGPAYDLMVAAGYEPNSRGVYALYEPFVNRFIQDTRDPIEVPGSLRVDTLMASPHIAAELMRLILSLKSDVKRK